ncbi:MULTISPECIES: GNAT family N-acetyltransferase [Cyanophyceae]|uniref:GNAT family N-acetyltransferase n=1 Tax=Cyanophyceae TaxID=3028117 RepID=UPI0016856936|nr:MULTISPECIES: GNAT family N-acetyltransferase [Cyanophyceae]MBD1915155.1 GNAT family N-acetyltransferase [Phormidium sp. FACHB-77]MBD2030926.1 GNAT family N-acetyltransferase [Phormidium sp. FACHB-322]MBD2050727.1 GNAT family N-acetyltransferase [Leptolyngbya sp. FACHB-60]
MIRPTITADASNLISLANATGLFESHQLKELSTLLANSLDDTTASKAFWLTDDDSGPVGVAYCEPERMTDQTWNLQLIAIHPSRQGQGRGTALLRHVEQTLAAQGGRLLIVETSGSPDFERVRTFYANCSYQEEGRIRDFYATGYDKVTFRKVLGG